MNLGFRNAYSELLNANEHAVAPEKRTIALRIGVRNELRAEHEVGLVNFGFASSRSGLPDQHFIQAGAGDGAAIRNK